MNNVRLCGCERKQSGGTAAVPAIGPGGVRASANGDGPEVRPPHAARRLPGVLQSETHASCLLVRHSVHADSAHLCALRAAAVERAFHACRWCLARYGPECKRARLIEWAHWWRGRRHGLRQARSSQ